MEVEQRRKSERTCLKNKGLGRIPNTGSLGVHQKQEQLDVYEGQNREWGELEGGGSGEGVGSGVARKSESDFLRQIPERNNLKEENLKGSGHAHLVLFLSQNIRYGAGILNSRQQGSRGKEKGQKDAPFKDTLFSDRCPPNLCHLLSLHLTTI